MDLYHIIVSRDSCMVIVSNIAVTMWQAQTLAVLAHIWSVIIMEMVPIFTTSTQRSTSYDQWFEYSVVSIYTTLEVVHCQ